MSRLLDPVGFVADCIAIANAFGIYTPAQQEQSRKLLEALEETQDAIQILNEGLESQAKEIKSMIATSTVIEVRSRLPNVTAIPSEQLELLIKLLFYMKEVAHNVVFAIIVKYRIGRTVATLGFAGASADAIEELVQKVNDFCRGISHVNKEMTVYITVRIRGKFTVRLENACAAALTAIATEVCGLSRNVEVRSVNHCPLEATGAKTLVLLHSAESDEPQRECDRLRRTFLVGDTRSGKSTLGNALLQEGLFSVSRGMTGTMRIERGERAEQIGDELWLTEIYDTPGLNDKDGLDVLYQTAIEDYIRMLQRASTLIMTVGVDSGITNSASKSTGAYKKLFGESMASMLITVLTVNEPADADELRDYLDLNWPTVAAIDNRIMRRNVFCVSLHDLRESKDSASHKVVEEILHASRAMPMKVIEALEKRYQALRDSLAQRSCDLHREMQTIMDSGWQAYDNLTDRFESCRYVKLTDTFDGFMNGFVMKGTDAVKKVLAIGSVGIINAIRKTAVHVSCQDKSSHATWDKFLDVNCNHRHGQDLMRLFGDMVYENGLGVTVSEMKMTFVGTLRVRRYKVHVFDPVTRTHEDLRVKLQQLVKETRDETDEELRPEVIRDLTKSALPSIVPCRRKPSSKLKKKNTILNGFATSLKQGF